MTKNPQAELWSEVTPEAARRLMVAAVESFAERGYHATTTRDIATAAGMSPAALYVHFPSKAAVLFEISRRGHEKALALVRSVTSGDPSPAVRMGALVEEFVCWHAQRQRVARVVQYELHALPESEFAVVAELRRETEQVVRDLISEGNAGGDFKASDVPAAARAVLSLTIDVARWYRQATAPPPRELGRTYARLVLGMLGANQ